MPSESHPARPHADAVIDTLAASQHGVVTRAQLLEAGLSRHVIEYRVGRCRLRPVFRGVYRVGPIVAAHACDMAAVLACGARAVLSHMSALSLWDLRPARGGSRRVDVTVAGGFRAPAPTIRLHRTGAMQAPVASDDGRPPRATMTAPAASDDGRRREQR